MKFVVAGNFQEYTDYINRKEYNPREYVYVSDPMQLRGRTEIEGFYIGSYESRPDIDQIKETIAFIKAWSGSYVTNSSQVSIPAPTSIMIKKRGTWDIYDLKANTVTSVPITDDV